MLQSKPVYTNGDGGEMVGGGCAVGDIRHT